MRRHAATEPSPHDGLRAGAGAVRCCATNHDLRTSVNCKGAVAVNKVYAAQKTAVDAPCKAKIRAADKGAHETKLKALKTEHDASLAEIRKKYPAPSAAAGTAGTPK